MSTTLESRDPKFLVIECISTWSGACSYILTSCKSRTKATKACNVAVRCLKKNEGQTIEFSLQTLQEFVEDSCILDEIRDGDRDGFEGAALEQLTIANIFLPGNLALLHEIVDQLFETGYENGIIANYIACDDVPVLNPNPLASGIRTQKTALPVCLSCD